MGMEENAEEVLPTSRAPGTAPTVPASPGAAGLAEGDTSSSQTAPTAASRLNQQGEGTTHDNSASGLPEGVKVKSRAKRHHHQQQMNSHPTKGRGGRGDDDLHTESWLQWLLGLFVMVDVSRVRRGDQRKACYCYIVLLVGYLMAMMVLTVSTFQDRRNPPTSLQLLDDQEWRDPVPPNMMICHWAKEVPVWLLANYQSFDKHEGKYGKWMWRQSFMDRVQVMECGRYKDYCVFIQRSLEGPEKMGQFLQGRSLQVKVGYTMPAVGVGEGATPLQAAATSPVDLGLSIWFTDSPTPQAFCDDNQGDNYSTVDGFTQAVAHLYGGMVDKIVWPYDIMVLQRTKRTDLIIKEQDKLLSQTKDGWRYTANLIPSLNMTAPANVEDVWSMPLLNSAERQAVEAACGGGGEGEEGEKARHACYEEEIAKRITILKNAGERGMYFNFQVWLWKQVTVVTEKDPFNLIELASLWAGGWGWVTIIFGVCFWSTFYDTREAATCLHRKWWTRLGKKIRRCLPHTAAAPSSSPTHGEAGHHQQQHAVSGGEGGGKGGGHDGGDEEEEEVKEGQRQDHHGDSHRHGGAMMSGRSSFFNHLHHSSNGSSTSNRNGGNHHDPASGSRGSSSSSFHPLSRLPLPAVLEFDSVYLDLQDLHPDLKRMRDWFIRMEQQQQQQQQEDEEEEEGDEEEGRSDQRQGDSSSVHGALAGGGRGGQKA